ncbi:ATP-binding cassette domain-containing protein [Deltaproteobacteria bacterium]|nr:ATP-binding cassette domain-containing protein [Deltaproteobacteria bacterium]
MSLVTVIDLCLAFSGKELFNNLGFQVEPGDRIGLVGPNGSGKTSLLRLLAGENRPDKGEIRITGGSLIGYLPQDVGEKLSGPLLNSVIDSIPGRVSICKEIDGIKQALKQESEGQEQERLAARLAEAHHDMTGLENRFPTHRAEKILEGLGFKSVDFDKPVLSLSGGWRMRASLGSILFQEPDLLLLDEPTNYLDIPSVRWLEQFLRDYKGSIMLVCHDRDFLNRQIQRVMSFEPEGMRSYKGNYDQYLRAREEEIKGLEARKKNQEQKVKEAKRFIERFRAKATKARQAQSKIKLLKKVELVRSHRKEKNIRFSFPEVPRSGRLVVTIQGLAKGFDNKTLYKDIDLTVLRGERIALIGPNGFGKTTMLRMLAGEILPDQGTISLGHKVDMSYYAQHHSEMLDPNKSVIEEVYQIVPHESVSFVRSLCGSFMFSGDDVDKPVKVLSGGEKARVSLAKILIKPGNLLVMDEPTNHLDLISSEILIDALSDFNGSLLFVSHNQSFINRLATKIWDIRDNKIIEYPGSLYEYYDHLEKLDMDPLAAPPEEAEEDRKQGNEAPLKIRDSKKAIRKKNAEKRNLINSELRPVLDKLSRLEDRIADLEKREKEISDLLADPDLFKDKNKSLPLLNEYRRVKGELEATLFEWEKNQDRLEELKEDLGVSDQT